MDQSVKIGLVAGRAMVDPTGVGEYTRNLLQTLQPKMPGLCCLSTEGQTGSFWHKVLAPFQLRSQGFSLLHFMAEWELYFFRAGSAKTVVTIHGCASNVLPPELHEQMPRHVLLKYRYLLRRADAIVTVSEASKRDIIEVFRVPPEKVTVIYNGISELFRQRALSGERPLSNERPFILGVGATIPKKNVIGMLRALAILKSAGFPHRFVHVGPKGWGHEAILREVQRLGLHNDIELKGYLPAEELVRYYTTADVFLFPSLHEGFGMPILEAMACGCPVVASDCHSMPEVAGGAALLVDPYDPARIAEAVERLLTDGQTRQHLIEKGRQRAPQFPWEKTASEVLALYQRVMTR
jgi:glycosyltransferase involved in cell wall biosynthesis